MMRHTGSAVAEAETPATPAARERFRLSTFDSLRHRDYRLLFGSILFSSAGQWMEQIALSWMAYQMTNDAFMLGLINGMRAIPFLVMGPWAGVAADRMDRKKLMVFSQVYVMALTVAMTMLIVWDLLEVWHLFAFTLLNGMGWAFTQPVRQTLIPNLVPRSDMMNAVALQSAAMNSTRILGPSVAGVLMGTLGPAWVFGFKASLYVFIITLLLMLRVPATRTARQPASAGHELAEGFRYILHNEVVFWLILLALIPMLFAMPFQTLMPIFARDVLEVGPQGFGILVSFSGAGALVGTLTVASLGGFQRKGLLLLLAGTALGTGLVLFSQATWALSSLDSFLVTRYDISLGLVSRAAWMPLSLLILVFVGGFQMTYMSMTNTLLHLNITDEVRGRVMSIYMLDHGLTPLGALLAGATAGIWGAPLAVSLMGLSCLLLASTALIHVPQIRRLA